MKSTYILFTLLIMAIVISCTNDKTGEQEMKVMPIDLSEYSSEKPDQPIHLLFIHHSTGGQLVANKGPEVGENCIYSTQPNGGGLRRLLEKNNYIVHEASYGSLIGDKTDICHWNSKFKDNMDKVLTCKYQDEFFNDGTKNKIIMFKSCYPNSWIKSQGKEPGDADSCEKTMANYKATYNNLLEYFRKQPDTLFVVVTAPPLAKPVLFKKGKVLEFLKTITGRPDTIEKAGNRVRFFNNWLKDKENGWLKGYGMPNVVVFDYYDILTNYGESNWSKYPSGSNGTNSHPNSDGNMKAAQEFVPLLNKSVNRMGMAD